MPTLFRFAAYFNFLLDQSRYFKKTILDIFGPILLKFGDFCKEKLLGLAEDAIQNHKGEYKKKWGRARQ